ncbi:MAG: UDP-N-acetylmuramate--L-alanine ligase [Bacteroidota bacterium]|nr:UDP-N-acetylmuramate--L-alanine ligase [Candidatus Kapabacteria bacterium]MDW8270948.1 UDP-N-acetylmuramate--L-alanine ligase [Bacteroidota bacterium]
MVISLTPSQTVERLYFLGVGGIAMGSVAIACKEMGAIVSGCDSNVYPPMSILLERSGIPYANTYDPEHLLAFSPHAVIVGNAISRGNPVLEVALDRNIPLLSMPELLRWSFMQRSRRIVVSGTHGKTTTTSLLAWILHRCGAPVGYLIGGAVDVLGHSCRPAPPDGYFVLEGDEYDTAFFDKRSKFLHSMPTILIVTSIEYDHADIFPSYDAVVAAFRQLIRLVPQTGAVFICGDDQGAVSAGDYALSPVYLYGTSEQASWRATDIHFDDEFTSFSIIKQGSTFGQFRIPLIGEHNVRNATAAIAVASHLGLSPAEIATALEEFRPPKRRFELLCQWRGALVVDDFAHHPTAIRATLQAARHRYPHRRIVACFEPRSNTAAQAVFQHAFADALAAADLVFLCPVYRAERYSPDQRLNRELLSWDLSARGIECYVIPDGPAWGNTAFEMLRAAVHPNDLVILMSNGNIGGLRQLIISDAQTTSPLRQA